MPRRVERGVSGHAGNLVPLDSRRRTDLATREIRRVSCATGLDQAELAALIGKSPRTLRRWLHGDGLDVLRAYLVMCEAAGRRAA